MVRTAVVRWTCRVLVTLTCVAVLGMHPVNGEEQIMMKELRMPPYTPEGNAEDVYLCTSFPMPPDMHSLTDIIPHAKQEEVHHMLLFGCNEPQKEEGEVWMCHGHDICKDASQTLYGWGKDAPPLKLPHDSGFAIGVGTQLPKLVIQVHYLLSRPPGDVSGVDVVLSSQVQRSTVSLLAFAPGFSIPPRTPAFDAHAACCYEGFQPLRAIAYRVHTHDLGELVSLDASPVSWDTVGVEASTVRVAERDPQLPQMFEPVTQPATVVLPGTFLKSTCRFNSTTRSHATVSGWTHEDEMCNIYYMVYSEQPHFHSCWNRGGKEDNSADVGPEAVPFPMPPITTALSVAGSLPTADVGPISGVAVNPLDGSLWLLVRRGMYWTEHTFNEATNEVTSRELIQEDTVIHVDPVTGSILKSWGANSFSMPHGITVDWFGNVWITDVGRHQVFKYSQDGTLLLTLGTGFTPGNTGTTFCKPTDVAVLADGTVYISDGYCNSRVLLLSATLNNNHNNGANEPLELESIPLPTSHQTLIHGVAVNGCRGKMIAIDREAGVMLVNSLKGDNMDTVQLASRLGFTGQVRLWAVRTGPRGDTYMLIQSGGDWANSDVFLVSVDDPAGPYYVKLEGVSYPHDLAFGTLDAGFVTSDVPIIVYVSETPTSANQRAKIHRFVLAKEGWSSTLVSASASTHSLPPQPETLDAAANVKEHDADSRESEPESEDEGLASALGGEASSESAHVVRSDVEDGADEDGDDENDDSEIGSQEKAADGEEEAADSHIEAEVNDDEVRQKTVFPTAAVPPSALQLNTQQGDKEVPDSHTEAEVKNDEGELNLTVSDAESQEKAVDVTSEDGNTTGEDYADDQDSAEQSDEAEAESKKVSVDSDLIEKAAQAMSNDGNTTGEDYADDQGSADSRDEASRHDVKGDSSIGIMSKDDAEDMMGRDEEKRTAELSGDGNTTGDDYRDDEADSNADSNDSDDGGNEEVETGASVKKDSQTELNDLAHGDGNSTGEDYKVEADEDDTESPDVDGDDAFEVVARKDGSSERADDRASTGGFIAPSKMWIDVQTPQFSERQTWRRSMRELIFQGGVATVVMTGIAILVYKRSLGRQSHRQHMSLPITR